MTTVLIVLLLAAVVAGVWSSHRYHQVSAWEDELSEAFGTAEQRVMPRHRAV
jgi:hypothetical protein